MSRPGGAREARRTRGLAADGAVAEQLPTSTAPSLSALPAALPLVVGEGPVNLHGGGDTGCSPACRGPSPACILVFLVAALCAPNVARLPGNAGHQHAPAWLSPPFPAVPADRGGAVRLTGDAQAPPADGRDCEGGTHSLGAGVGRGEQVHAANEHGEVDMPHGSPTLWRIPAEVGAGDAHRPGDALDAAPKMRPGRFKPPGRCCSMLRRRSRSIRRSGRSPERGRAPALRVLPNALDPTGPYDFLGLPMTSYDLLGPPRTS